MNKYGLAAFVTLGRALFAGLVPWGIHMTDCSLRGT